MPEPTERQRREKFVLSVAYSPGGWGRLTLVGWTVLLW